MKTFLLLIGATSLLAGVAWGGPIPVTSCGQVIAGSGALVGDLDCSAEADEAVKVSGRLYLGGFTLTGNPAFDVVRCEPGRCTVIGPGTITGGMDGVRGDRSVKLKAGVVVTGNTGDGVRSDGSTRVYDSTVSGNDGDGVRADKSASVRDSTVASNGETGIQSEVTAKATRSDVTANGLDGLKGIRVVLSNATATGNGTDASCGVVDDCADLASAVRPSLRGTSTCGTSRNTESSGTWGVCTND